ncbi:biotin/lipoate A/B protein ligase family protein [Candidatus Margulisiibacteriota bacterium]
MEDVVWHVLNASKASGRENMEADTNLFNVAEAGHLKNPTIRIYGWKDHCISLGHSQDANEELHVSDCVRHGVEVVKRPTGGGIVLHNPHEITYSIVSEKNWIPFKDLINSFVYISEAIVEGLKHMGVDAELSDKRQKGFARYCNLFPASHEIVYGGKKLVGSAQKRGKKALLQQGSIIVHKGNMSHERLIKRYSGDYEAKSTSVSEVINRIPTYKELQNSLMEGFKRKFRVVTI